MQREDKRWKPKGERRFIGEQVSEGKRQMGGKKCSQGNHGAKKRGMDGGEEERRNNEKSRQGC